WQAASTPRRTLHPSKLPVATSRANRRNHFSTQPHSPVAPDASLASGFLSSRDRSLKRLRTPPVFSAPARALRHIHTRAKAKKASPNPQGTFRAGVRASKSPAGSALWFVQPLRPAARAKGFCPATNGHAGSAAAAP